MELLAPFQCSLKLHIQIPFQSETSILHTAVPYGRATDAYQIRKERALSAGLSFHIQSDSFATEQSLSYIYKLYNKVKTLYKERKYKKKRKGYMLLTRLLNK